ncbi:hypothetical protein KHA80_13330 [Anaerobacillus sp. HL2]|nr:hypothetical protein KHA80_13330 [Anaerobacillus sp. HL2]
MLEKVNGKLTEERYREYQPLTDEQKEAMSEKDVERWEERAMSGLLRGDKCIIFWNEPVMNGYIWSSNGGQF